MNENRTSLKSVAMDKILLKLSLALFTVLAVIGLNQVYAASTPLEFHADAKMRLADGGAVNRTYGYMRVLADGAGNGLVDVMFSNASSTLKARFNARVEFLDANGRIVREEHFDCRLGRAGSGGTRECKQSRMLRRSWFDKVKVDFYLTDVPQANFVSQLND